MVDYNFITELIKDLEQFAQKNHHSYVDKKAFASYLLEQCKLETQQTEEEYSYHGKHIGSNMVNTISNLVTSLNRYKMNYIKLALEGSVFETYDEFAFVLSLVYVGDYTPSKLIERHVQAKPTGTEIIRRLLRKELVEEYPSLEDKRSKWLKVTQKGREDFFKSMKKIKLVTEMVMSPLNDSERKQLLVILQKLDQPHRELFVNHKKGNLEDYLNYFNLPTEESN